MNIKKILRIIKSSRKVTFDTERHYFKVTDSQKIDWAFIQYSELGKECEVKFVDSESILFDEMTFDYLSQAIVELERNGFVELEPIFWDERDRWKCEAYASEAYIELQRNGLNEYKGDKPPLPPYYDKRGKNSIYSSGECWTSPTKIRVDSNDYWVKAVVFEFFDLRTALIEKQKDGVCKVFFIRDDSYIYDVMSFDSIKEVEEGLTRNGFERYDSITKPDNIERHGNNKRLHDEAVITGIRLPEQPFKEDKYFFSGGYSLRGFWK